MEVQQQASGHEKQPVLGVVAAPMIAAPPEDGGSYLTSLPRRLWGDGKAGGKDQHRKVTREEVDLLTQPSSRCFLLSDVLGAEECAELIEAAECAGSDGGPEAGWEMLARLFPTDYRGGDRLLVMDEQLAQLLWLRIKPALTRNDVLRVRPIGFGNAGTWLPYRLNECLKLVRYKSGDHFSYHATFIGHVDGPWVPRSDESSVYTVIIYLNDDFKGGCTNFRYEGSRELLWRVTPRRGQALIFNHDTFHEGEPVTEGTKYILRTEMMFTRVDNNVFADDDYLTKPTYKKLVKVYEQSQEAHGQGDVSAFVAKYLEAIQLQCQEQRSLGKDRARLDQELALPNEIYIRIFQYLTPAEIGRLQQVSKLWYEIAQDGVLWKQIYVAKWGNGTAIGNVPNAEIEDWYGCWKARLSFERASSPAIVAVDFGSHSIKCMRTTDVLGEYHRFADLSVFSSISDSGPWHYRVAARYLYGTDALQQEPLRAHKLINRGEISTLLKVQGLTDHWLESLKVPPHSPLVFSGQAFWDWGTQNLKAPFVCAEEPGVLVLASYGYKTGIVVDVGFEVMSVSPVYEGKLLSKRFTAQSKRSCVLQGATEASHFWAYGDDRTCPNCLAKFTLLRRRHHCRQCGSSLCRSCMPALNKQRICPACKGVQPKAEDKDEHIENEKNHPSWTQNSSRRETQAIAAHLLASVLSHLHMHKNSRELNLIDLEPLVHNIVITGGETMIQGWDNDFETELAALAKDFKFTVLKVDRQRAEMRRFDAVQGALMMAEARPQTPLEQIYKWTANVPSGGSDL